MPLTISLSLFWLIIVYFSIHLPFPALFPFSHKFKEMSPSIPPHSGYSSYTCNLVRQTFSPMCLGQESAFGTLHFLCFPTFDLCTRRSISEKYGKWNYKTSLRSPFHQLSTSFSPNLLTLSTCIYLKPPLSARLWLSCFWASVHTTRWSCQTTAYVLGTGDCICMAFMVFFLGRLIHTFTIFHWKQRLLE